MFVYIWGLSVCGCMGCVYIDMVCVCLCVCLCMYVWDLCVPMCGMCVYVWGLCVCMGCVCMRLCVFLCIYVRWVRIDVLNEPLPMICKLCVSVS